MKSLFFLSLILSANLYAQELLFEGTNKEGKPITVDFNKKVNSYVLQFDKKILSIFRPMNLTNLSICLWPFATPPLKTKNRSIG